MTLTVPSYMPMAWASGTGLHVGNTNAISSASAAPANASLYDGFPIEQMTAPGSGGVPPQGGDFNGILKWITQFQVFTQSGGLPEFNAAQAAAIGGYPIGSVVQLNNNVASVAATALTSVDPNGLTVAQLIAGTSGWAYYSGGLKTSATIGSAALRDSNGALTASNFLGSGAGLTSVPSAAIGGAVGSIPNSLISVANHVANNSQSSYPAPSTSSSTACGMNLLVTPTRSGLFLVAYGLSVVASSSGVMMAMLACGTGSSPAQGASPGVSGNAAIITSNMNTTAPLFMTGVGILGSIPIGTPYWIDIIVTPSASCSLSSLYMTAVEI